MPYELYQPRSSGGGGGSGTVTSVSVVSANGLAGTVANATTTPAITLSTSVTGILKGNGTAISAAVANTDYLPVASPTFTGTLTGDNIQTSGSSGVVLKNSAGTTVATFGSAGTTNISFAGTVAMGANNLTMTGSLAATGARVTKGWFTDVESTNMPTVGGTSLSSIFSPIAGSSSITTVGTLVAGSIPYSLITGGPSAFAWGATATGTSGTGVALTVGNSASAATIGQSITIGNTQTQVITGLNIDTGSSTPAHIGINIANRSGNGIEFASASAQSVASGVGIYINKNASYNTNSSFNYTGIQILNTVNAGSGVNTGLRIDNNGTTGIGIGAGEHGLILQQAGVGGTVLFVGTGNNINSSTNGLVNYTLSNTQSGATVMQKIDTGSSAQGHVLTQYLAYNASSSLKVIDVQASTTGTGKVLSATKSSTERLALNPFVADGASAIAYLFDAATSLTTAGAKLASFKNAGTEKAYIDKDGGALFSGAVQIGGIANGGRLLSVDSSGRGTFRYDDNSTATNVTLANYGLTASSQGTQIVYNLGVGGSAGGVAVSTAAVATDTWAAAGNRSADFVVYTRSADTLSERFRVKANGNAVAAGAFTSGTPNGGTAADWKLGTIVTGQVGLVLVSTQYIQLDINGTLYRLATV